MRYNRCENALENTNVYLLFKKLKLMLRHFFDKWIVYIKAPECL